MIKHYNSYQIFSLLILFIYLSASVQGQDWERLNDTPFLKHHSNGFGFGDKAYVFEGTFGDDGPNGVSNEVWEYDAPSDTWTRIEDFPGPGRAISIGDELDGKYYHGFGRGASGFLNDLWVYDPVDNSHRELPACPCVGRTHPAFIAYKGKIHMGSGSTASGDTDDWWEFDIATEVWTQKQDIPGGNRHHPFFFENEDKVYLGGGHVDNWLEYDLLTEQWNEIDNTPRGRVAGSQLTYNGLGFLIGGDDAQHNHVPSEETFMSYDPDEDEWTFLTPLPNGSRWANSSFIINNELYYFGGLSDIIPGDVSMWKMNLNFLECLPAQNLTTTLVTDVSANIIWSQGGDDVESDTLKWRELGSSIWNLVPNPQAVYVLEGLSACTEYEMVITSQCESTLSASESVVFKTDGCCEVPELEIAEVEENGIALSWEPVLAVEEFELRWRDVDDMQVWKSIVLTDQNFDIPDLQACTEYEVQLNITCASGEVVSGTSYFILTKGCGACLDNSYCDTPAQFDGSLIFINEVGINDYVNTSGNDGGYGNFVVRDGEAIKLGEDFSLTLDPGLTDQGFPSAFTVWIDYDGDGSFENDELAYQVFNVGQTITKTLTMPADATPGLTRMRVFFGIFSDNNPCEVGAFSLGEAEDYCIVIEEPLSAVQDVEQEELLKVFPNPFNSSISIESELFNQSNNAYALTVRNILGETFIHMEDFNPQARLDLSTIPNGLYLLSMQVDGRVHSVKLLKQE